MVVTSAKRAKDLGAQPMVRIVAQATSGVEPKWVMMAPVDAVRKIWEKTGWKNEDVDLYELNEAFSVQALGVTRELGLDPNKVNVNGGAVAIGHPIGASGARVLVTLIYEMAAVMRSAESPHSAWAEATLLPWLWNEISTIQIIPAPPNRTKPPLAG